MICMMLQIRASDPALRRELGSIKNPTILAFNDKIEGFEQAKKRSLPLHMAWLPRALLPDAIRTLLTRKICNVLVKLVEVVKEANAPHCAAGALDALEKITCSRSAPTRRLLNAIPIMGQVIFRRLAGRGRQLTHPTHNSQFLQHLLLFRRCIN